MELPASLSDFAGIIQSKAIIIPISALIHVGLQVEGHILAVALHGFHVFGHLHGQAAGGLVIAEDNVQHRLAGDTELCHNGVRLGFKFPHHGWVAHRGADDHGLAAHAFSGFQNVVQILLVVGGVGLALIAAIGEILPEVASGDGDRAGVECGVGPVLQGNGQVPVAAGFQVLHAVAIAAGAFHKDDGGIRFLGGIHPGAELGNQGGIHGIDVPLRLLYPHEAHAFPDVPVGNIELQALFQGQAASPVLQQHHALVLGLQAMADEFRAADDPGVIRHGSPRNPGADGISEKRTSL